MEGDTKSWPELFIWDSGITLQWTPLQVLVSIIVVFSLRYLWSYLTAEDESPEAITVPEPEAAKPGWKGEILESPEIKVAFSHPICIISC